MLAVMKQARKLINCRRQAVICFESHGLPVVLVEDSPSHVVPTKFVTVSNREGFYHVLVSLIVRFFATGAVAGSVNISVVDARE